MAAADAVTTKDAKDPAQPSAATKTKFTADHTDKCGFVTETWIGTSARISVIRGSIFCRFI